MPINSRQKGKTGELDAARALTLRGHPSHRSQQFSGRAGDADLVCPSLDRFHLEVKRVQGGNIHDWIAQSVGDAKFGKVPIVMHRKNNREWVVSMPLDDFLKLAA